MTTAEAAAFADAARWAECEDESPLSATACLAVWIGLSGVLWALILSPFLL